MYGGKVDDEADFQTLRALIYQIMTPAAFESGHYIVKITEPELEADDGNQGLLFTAETSWEALIRWIDDLPEREPPTYLGLPPNAEKILLVEEAKGIIKSLRLILGLLDEGDHLIADVNQA